MVKKRVKIVLRSYVCLALLFLSIQYCSEPFNFNIESQESVLVVDGFITDQFKEHEIRLSATTSRIEDIAIPNPVLGARVELRGDQGTVFRLREGRNGSYLTPPMEAVDTIAYQLIVFEGNDIYQSDFESLPKADTTPGLRILWNTNEFRNIIQGSLVISRPGLLIEAQIDKSIMEDQQGVHYQWFISDCRILGLPRVGFRTCDVFGDIQRDPQLYLHKDNYLPGSENERYFNELTWIPKPNSANVSGTYVVEIDQMIISSKAFEYWSAINDQIGRTGTFFDPTPARITGNIEDEVGDKVALGFFGVYRESSNWVRLMPAGF